MRVDLAITVAVLVATWVVWLALALVASVTMGGGEVAIALAVPTIVTIMSVIARERDNA